MKKTLLFISSFILLLMIFPSTTLAVNQSEWELKRDTKVGEAATLYAIDTAEDGTRTLREIGSIPAGTYIDVDDYDPELNIKYIQYYQNGAVVSGIISRNAPLKIAQRIIWFTDGTMDYVPEKVAENSGELKKWLSVSAPGKKVYAISNVGQASPLEYPQTLDEGETRILNESDADSINPGGDVVENKPTQAKDPNTDTTGYVQGEWTEQNEISEEEKAFNATCPSRLKRTIWGYSDAHLKTKYEKINIGTYCCITNDFNDVVQIAYYKNGVKHSAYIEKSDILGNYSVYIDDKGESQTVYAGDPNYESIVANHEVTWTAETISQDLDGQVAAEKSKGNQSGSSGKKTNSDTEKSKKVNVSTIGLVTSTIYYEDKKLEVPTSQLTFSENVPEDKQLAVIYAPRTGKCSLRKTESDKSKLLKKCKAGTVVIVLEYGEGHCKINYKGTDGYVSTDCLKFYGTNVKALGTGVLSYNGKTTGKTTINIRNAPDKSSETIDEWRTGTKVAVFCHEDGWYEVELNGIHGYIMEKFLTLK